MIEMDTGKKYCVDMLGQYLGLSADNGFSNLLGTICVLLSMALPVLALIFGVFLGYRNLVKRRKISATRHIDMADDLISKEMAGRYFPISASEMRILVGKIAFKAQYSGRRPCNLDGKLYCRV